MSLFFKIKHFFYVLALNAIEFVFFFTHYWWWKLQWLLLWNYHNTSGLKIYLNEKGALGGLSEDNFSFGETNALPTKLILQEINPQKGSVIYDLGSGRGIFLFSAYFLFDLRGVGIEIFNHYIEKCPKINRSLKVGGVIFKQGNIIDTDLSEADIVYISGATFQKEILERLKENLKKIKPDTVVIIIRNTLPEDDFVLFHEGNYPFSWGCEHVYFYKRKDDEY